MSTTIFDLHAIRFDTRIALGGCMMNIDGVTFDCEVDKDSTNFTAPTYHVKRKDNGKELCTFRPWHVFALAQLMFQIEGVSEAGGTGTLIVPSHGMLDADDTDDDEDERYASEVDALST